MMKVLIYLLSPIINVPKSVFALLPRARNPFSFQKSFPASSLVSEKMKESGGLLAAISDGQASEQFLPITNP